MCRVRCWDTRILALVWEEKSTAQHGGQYSGSAVKPENRNPRAHCHFLKRQGQGWTRESERCTCSKLAFCCKTISQQWINPILVLIKSNWVSTHMAVLQRVRKNSIFIYSWHRVTTNISINNSSCYCDFTFSNRVLWSYWIIGLQNWQFNLSLVTGDSIKFIVKR